MDEIPNKVVQSTSNRPTSSCGSGGPAAFTAGTGSHTTLCGDLQMRLAFIHGVAAPIVNKMFVCGLTPDRYRA